MSKLNKGNFTIQVKRGLRASLLKTTHYFSQGEPLYTTDTKQLFIHDGIVVQPVQTLDMALVDMSDGQIITDRENGTISYTF